MRYIFIALLLSGCMTQYDPLKPKSLDMVSYYDMYPNPPHMTLPESYCDWYLWKQSQMKILSDHPRELSLADKIEKDKWCKQMKAPTPNPSVNLRRYYYRTPRIWRNTSRYH